MSTITLLSPLHRQRRSERRNLINSLRSMLRSLTGPKLYAGLLILDVLMLVRRDSDMHGDTKHAIFTNSLMEFAQ